MRLSLLLILITALPLQAQFTYTIDQSIPVQINGEFLDMPWAGGINSAQVSTIDLDSDGNNDLAVFDRSSGKIQTYINQNNTYRYAPEYEALFPDDVGQWMLLRDFNCDGKKDIFTSDPFGIAVFVNITESGGNLAFREFNPGFPLLSIGKNGQSSINIKVNETDIPVISDLDNDGDLDILIPAFAGVSGKIEYYKNVSIDSVSNCDSLQYRRVVVPENWGGFEECDCGDFAFGETCQEKNGGRTAHAGGKSLAVLDTDGDGDKELLFSEEDCTRLYLLENVGDSEEALLTSSSFFPTASPVNFLIFPAAFIEDVDFDGKPDLLSSPNVYARTNLNNPFQNSLWFYKNTGSATNPSFTFIQDDFLQDKMIDVGDYAYPAFADYDGDGDEDMFIGNYGNLAFIGVIALYENIGTPITPSFRLVTNDFASFSQFLQYSVKPQIVDINADGNQDFVILAADPGSGSTNLLFVEGKSPNALDISNQELQATGFQVDYGENTLLVDVDLDGKVDLLVGRTNGALEYWHNDGNPNEFSFGLSSSEFMGLGESITRTKLSATVADLDGDSRQDLVVGDQLGNLTIFGDFRETQNNPQPATEIIYDSFNQVYSGRNLGGRIKPTAVNLFGTDKPAIAVGTVTGGMLILRNDGGQQLPPEPVITIYPNPLPRGEVLTVRSDRNALMQVFSVLGQKMSEPFFVTANQPLPVRIEGLAPGMYIASFTIGGKRFGRRLVIY